MLHLFFPIGTGTGWDTCGKHLVIELSKLENIALVTESQITPEKIGNELEYFSISQNPVNTINENNFDRDNALIKGVSIRMLNDFDLNLWIGDIKSERTIGYTFYYGSPLSADHLNTAKKYDLIVAGSSFCEAQLNSIGLNRTKTIIQGINPQIFNPVHSTKSILGDRFIIFSGGKFELRKGQDIVLRSFKIFSQRHSDALLVNSWFNQWDFSLNTIAVSALIDFKFDPTDYMASMQNLYKINEIDPTKVITLPIKTPHQLAYIFKNTDVGLFPNRCEGGTNLMLMEYMACGKPVIATKKTGHADIVMDNNTFTIERYIPLQIREGNLSKYKGWVEPDVDEIVNHLETAYNNQERCKQKGQAAGELLSELTWQKAAAAFHKTAMELI